MRNVELRRHAPRDPDADRLSPEGQRLALEVGRNLPGGYGGAFSSPAKRAAETVAWVLRGLGQPLPEHHGVVEGLASSAEQRWRTAAKSAGAGRIDDFRRVDPELVDSEAPRLAAAVREILSSIPDGTRALAVGHSPLIEVAVYGLTGTVVDPLAECDGVLIEEESGAVRVAEEYRRA